MTTATGILNDTWPTQYNEQLHALLGTPMPDDFEPGIQVLSDLLGVAVPGKWAPYVSNNVHHGRKFGYPWCCVRQYCIDVIDYRDRLAEHVHITTNLYERGIPRDQWPPDPVHANRGFHPQHGCLMCPDCRARMDRIWPNRPITGRGATR